MRSAFPEKRKAIDCSVQNLSSYFENLAEISSASTDEIVYNSSIYLRVIQNIVIYRLGEIYFIYALY